MINSSASVRKQRLSKRVSKDIDELFRWYAEKVNQKETHKLHDGEVVTLGKPLFALNPYRDISINSRGARVCASKESVYANVKNWEEFHNQRQVHGS